MDQEAGAQGACAVLGAGKGGEGDRGHPPSPGMPERPHPSEELVSVDVRHADVAHQDVGPFGFDRPEGLGGRPGRDDLRVAFCQDPLNQIARLRLIVDHQHGHTRKVRALEIGGDAGDAIGVDAFAGRGLPVNDRERDLKRERCPLFLPGLVTCTDPRAARPDA